MSPEEFEASAVKEKIREFNQLIQEWIGEADLNDIPQELQDEYDSYEPVEPMSCKPDIDVLGEKFYDNLISAEVMLPVDGILIPATVTGCKRDATGQPVAIITQTQSWTQGSTRLLFLMVIHVNMLPTS